MSEHLLKEDDNVQGMKETIKTFEVRHETEYLTLQFPVGKTCRVPGTVGKSN